MSEKSESKRGFLLPGSLLEKAKSLGLSLIELQNMIRLSTRVTHEAGNRRYHDFYFMVEGNRIISLDKVINIPQVKTVDPEDLPPFKRVNCNLCHDTRKIRAFDECAVCEGVGCSSCDEGLVPSFIPCPTCVPRSVLSKQVL